MRWSGIGRGGTGRVGGGGIEGWSWTETALRGGGWISVGRRLSQGKLVCSGWRHGAIVVYLIRGGRMRGGQGRVRGRILRVRDRPGEGGGRGGVCGGWIMMGGIGGVMRKGLGRCGKAGHGGETELAETVRIKVGGGGEAV